MSVQALDSELCQVQLYVEEHCTDSDDDVAGDVSHVEQLLLNTNKLPPKQRLVLQSLYEEVSDLLRDKQAELRLLLDCLESAEIAYKVCFVLFCCIVRLHRMHEMTAVATDVRGVCLSVT